MILSYIFYSDPDHGWLRVKKKELEDLNIECNISNYSYISKDGQFVFLEEDRDLSIFFEAKKNINEWPLTIHNKHTNNDSKIRSYKAYYKPIKW